MNPEVKEFSEDNFQHSCNFCHKNKVNSLEWGPMYQLDGVTVHYFCMLFSAGLSQNGEDAEGILGFFPKDIRKELKRGEKLKCKFCRKVNATIGCSVRNCKASYHYPCGYENDCEFQFINNYESYCSKHRDRQLIPLPSSEWDCPICYTAVPKNETPLWPPCCKKRVFHRKCIMKMANNSGMHFFRCPLCNDKESFSAAMRKVGVYLPDRDAAWETEPNAFAEHAQLHRRCDAEKCECPEGRDFYNNTESKPWHTVRCGGCGAFAIHKFCGRLKNLTWRCPTCAEILSRSSKDPSMNSSRIQRTLDDSCSEDEHENENSPPIVGIQDVIREHQSAFPSVLNNWDSDSSSEEENENDDTNENASRQKFPQKDADPVVSSMYKQSTVVEVEVGKEKDETEGCTDDDEDIFDEVFCSPNPNAKMFKRSVPTSGSPSIPHKGDDCSSQNGSLSTCTARSGNDDELEPPPRNITFPALCKDQLIKSAGVRYVEGRVDLDEIETLVVLERDELATDYVSSEDFRWGSQNNTQSVNNIPTSFNESMLEKDRNKENLEEKDKTELSDNIKGFQNTPTKEAEFVNLDDEDSDSDLEVVGEKVVPKQLNQSAAVMELMRDMKEGHQEKRPHPFLRLGVDDHQNDESQTSEKHDDNQQPKSALPISPFRSGIPISSAYLTMIKKVRSQASSYFRGPIGSTQPKRYEVDLVNLDSDEENEKDFTGQNINNSGKIRSEDEARNEEPKKRERLNSPPSSLSQESCRSQSKKARNEIPVQE